MRTETHKQLQEVFGIVNDINADIYEANEDIVEEYGIYLEILTNGDTIIVQYLGCIIWNSENDERDFINEKDEYEDLNGFIRKSINNLTESICKVNIKINGGKHE